MKDNQLAIKVENVSKCYRIGLKEKMADTFAQNMFNILKSPYKNFKKYKSLYNFKEDELNDNGISKDLVWAVKDVSFEINVGEVVGIIGLNGAGKSTLLKILSRITEPTKGQISLRGKVSSLLEVGTGFHPDLTGRENVYLNGTILGMRKAEIDSKFDEIVDFSGVEKFIDTPVKRYSSGMRMRLAFAVAAHLEPEILLIDEVLAVGDVRFQKKCLNKMQDISQHGRTVLFVSHNMPAVTRLCPRAILLEGGRVLSDDISSSVVSQYMNYEKSQKAEREWDDLSAAPGDEVVRLRALRVKTKTGQVIETVNIHEPVGIEMEYDVLEPDHVFIAYYHVMNEEGIEAFTPFDTDPEWENVPRPVGRYVSTAWIPEDLLSEGMLYIGAAMRTLNPTVRRFRVNDAVAFQAVDVIDDILETDNYSGKFTGGVVRPILKWETKLIKQ